MGSPQRRRQLPAIALALALALAGCNVRPCAQGTLFVSVSYQGPASSADRLDIDVEAAGLSGRRASRPRTPGASGDSLEIAFAGAYPAGQEVRVGLTAHSGGAVVGTGSARLTPKAGCDTVAIVIGPATPLDLAAAEEAGLGDGALSDAAPVEDLATPPDLPPSDLASAADLAGAPDLTPPLDLAAPPDLAAPADLATPPDLAGPRDQQGPPDLAASPDLTMPADLAMPADLSMSPDLALLADLAMPRDFAAAPDLARPTTFYDSSANLTWQVSAIKGSLATVKAACTNLGVGWRVPSLNELRSLVRGCPSTQPGGACGTTDTCTTPAAPCWELGTCFQACAPAGGPAGGCYWPAELGTSCFNVGAEWSTATVNNFNQNWMIQFDRGGITSGDPANGNYTGRCVKTGR